MKPRTVILLLICLLTPTLPSTLFGQETALDYYNQAILKQAKDDLDGALADYNQAIKLKPIFAPAYNCRGTVKKIKGDLKGALADYTHAIDLEPLNVYFYVNRTVTRMDGKDLNGALADSTRVVELDP